MAYIYKITNQINGKVYIGKTLKTIEKRWKEHCKDCMTERCKNRPLYRAMNKYGVENFTIEQIEKCSPEVVSERERYWIEQYGSFKMGYNATIGGDGKQYIDYDLICSLYREVQSVKKVAFLAGVCVDTVRAALKNYNIGTIPGSLVRSREKPVAKCDKITGEILEVYPSIAEAEKANGNSRHIGEVCRGKRGTCQGYKWKYIN